MISLSVCYTPWVPHSQMVVCSWHVRSTLGIASESLEWEQMPPGHQLIYPLASPDEQNCILFISCWPQFQVSEVSLARPYSTSVLQISMAMVQEVAVVIENRNTSIVRGVTRHQSTCQEMVQASDVQLFGGSPGTTGFCKVQTGP